MVEDVVVIHAYFNCMNTMNSFIQKISKSLRKVYIPNFSLYADFWHTSVEVLVQKDTVHILCVTSAQCKPLSPKVNLFWRCLLANVL